MPRFTLWDQRGVSGSVDYELPVATTGSDWSDSNTPWAYRTTAAWESRLPAGVPVVNLSATGADFHARLTNTLYTAPGRVIVRLPAGVHTFTQFKPIGSSGDPTYAFGFWSTKLAGFIGAGTDRTIVEMAAGSTSQTQLDKMATMTQTSFVQLQMGLIRFDTEYKSQPAPIYLGGLTFEAGPQQPLTTKAADIPASIYTPQSAPHQGVVIYSSNNLRHPDSIITHVRFRGAGKAMMSRPPFELANISSQRNHLTFDRCEFDGRMSPRYDVKQPGKCGPFMTNGGITQTVRDSWMHGSNVSRYAANDESVASTAALSNRYIIERLKIEQITTNQNKQPGINGGYSLGGYTNASCIGFESSNALIEIIDSTVSVDNPHTDGQIPCHIQLTNTGASRPGGRLYIRGGQYRHTVHPQLDGYVTFRIQPSTNWWTDGFDTTLDVRNNNGTRLKPYVVTGTWPPTAAALAGTPSSSHYLVRAT